MVLPMADTSKQSKSNRPKTGQLEKDLLRTNQFSERTRREAATRSTLSRLRNRKSALK
jgi:hypothetical protein